MLTGRAGSRTFQEGEGGGVVGGCDWYLGVAEYTEHAPKMLQIENWSLPSVLAFIRMPQSPFYTSFLQKGVG